MNLSGEWSGWERACRVRGRPHGIWFVCCCLVYIGLMLGLTRATNNQLISTCNASPGPTSDRVLLIIWPHKQPSPHTAIRNKICLMVAQLMYASSGSGRLGASARPTWSQSAPSHSLFTVYLLKRWSEQTCLDLTQINHNISTKMYVIGTSNVILTLQS